MNMKEVGYDEFILGDSCPQYEPSFSEDESLFNKNDDVPSPASGTESNASFGRENDEVVPESELYHPIVADSLLVDRECHKFDVMASFVPDSEDPQLGLSGSHDIDINDNVPGSQASQFGYSDSDPLETFISNSQEENEEYGSPLDSMVEEMLCVLLPE